jgi:hypothetical protein
VARSSVRIGSIAVADTATPLRSVAALGLVDLAVLMLRASAVLLLLSPIVLAVILAFA